MDVENLRLEDEISACEEYRYRLRAEWSGGSGAILWVMLNPSTATARELDPTMRKVIGFTQRWGYAACEVVNLWAYRTPHPKELAAKGHPVGPETDAVIARAARRVDVVVAAWGVHGKGDRVAEVQALLAHAGHPWLLCLGTAKAGMPLHPLLVPYAQPLVVWRPRAT